MLIKTKYRIIIFQIIKFLLPTLSPCIYLIVHVFCLSETPCSNQCYCQQRKEIESANTDVGSGGGQSAVGCVQLSSQGGIVFVQGDPVTSGRCLRSIPQL
jgi:hypothetical protein